MARHPQLHAWGLDLAGLPEDEAVAWGLVAVAAGRMPALEELCLSTGTGVGAWFSAGEAVEAAMASEHSGGTPRVGRCIPESEEVQRRPQRPRHARCPGAFLSLAHARGPTSLHF